MRYHPLLLLLLLLALPVQAQTPAVAEPHAARLAVTGPIGPATADYVRRGIDQAVEQGARLVILRLDTPGGLDASMRDIIKAILASPIPIASYVAPNGARAASAGTYILYASHVAAMAPATNLGAATPVQIGGDNPLPGGGDQPPADGNEEPDTETPEQAPTDAMSAKAINDAVAYIRGLAQLRGRNADWAEKAVREAASLDAGAAAEQRVIDFIARDTGSLLQQADGMVVQAGGREVTLDTAGLVVRDIEPDWRTRLLSVITDPNIAYLLMLIGIYGLILEFANPGTMVAGTIGAISLLLALYALQVLPINYAGLGLIMLGLALMVAEAFAPSFGILGIGGVIAFTIGSVILMDTDAPGFGISLPLIGAVALITAAISAFVLGMLIRARKQPVVSGSEEMIGALAIAMESFDREGNVRAHGEIWRARSDVPVTRGERLRVTGLHGLTLEVTQEKETGEHPKGA